MIASLAWKEYREHRAVWLALALLAVVSLPIAKEIVLSSGWDGASEDGLIVLIGGAVILSTMYGLVCGAMMFASERESRGIAFLDILPLGRGELWCAKLLVGMAFTLLYSVVVIVIGMILGVVSDRVIPLPAATLLPLLALEAFAWGLCASTFCRTVLTAVTVAALVPLPLLWLFSGMCISSVIAGNRAVLPVVLVIHGCVTLGALLVSLICFLDRNFEKRFTLKPVASSYGAVAPKRQPRRWEVFLWLSLRRGVIVVAVLAVLGFLLGLGMPAAGVALWPVATLVLGVACGTSVFFGEQVEGAFKFWGDQRLPVAWMWLRRTALWAAVIVLVEGVMLLGALLPAAAEQEPWPDAPAAILDRLLGVPSEVYGPTGTPAFLLLWAAHGFAFGQYCSLVWRKSIVAAVVAVMAGAGSACLWVPSLVAGGLHPVQVIGVPLLLLGACRLVLWDWVTDRIKTRPAAARLVGGVLVSCVWLAVNMTYRVIEVPGGGEPFDLRELRAKLNDPEQNRAGLKISEALGVLNELEKKNRDKDREWARTRVNWEGNPNARAEFEAKVREKKELDRAETMRVVEHGWRGVDQDFGDWLDQMNDRPWADDLALAVRMPPGTFIAPGDDVQGRKAAADCRKAAELVTARALQLQARGEDEKALEHLLTVLALSRHLRHNAPAYAYQEGVTVEHVALTGLGHWLERLGRRPDLLRRALDELGRHESATPPVSEALAGEYVRFRQSLALGSGGRLNREVEGDLMQVPWEAARRLSDAVFAGRLRMAEAGTVVPPEDTDLLADWLPGPDGPPRKRLAYLAGNSWVSDLLPLTAPVQRMAQRGLCEVRAARLQVALMLFQCEQGRAAPSLDVLVPGVLAELPEDPFAHQPFRYRVSQGERIAWPRRLPDGGAEFVREVPAGAGILWSVGPDETDDGGKRQWEAEVTREGRDVVFLVPRCEKR